MLRGAAVRAKLEADQGFERFLKRLFERLSTSSDFCFERLLLSSMAARLANKTKEHDNSTTQHTDKGPTQPHARCHWRFVGARALSLGHRVVQAEHLCDTSRVAQVILPDARAPRAAVATRGALRADGCVKHGAHEGGDERARNLVCTIRGTWCWVY